MVQVLRLTRWELFKLRKRWMPWIILGIVILIAQVALWGAYFSYRTTDIGEVLSDPSLGGFGGPTAADTWECREIEHPSDVCEDQERGERLYRKFERNQFILPISLANSLAFAQLLGVILVPILASAAMGVEYGWGTLRTALTRGTGRWQLLVAKVVALMLLVVAGLLILSLTSVASSSIVGWLTLSDGLGFADSGKWSSAGVMFGKTVYSLVPYTLLALFFTVLTSSTGKGIALVLGYYFIELFAAGALFARFGWFHHISDFLLGPNIAGWIEGGTEAQAAGSLVQIPLANVPGNLHASLVLLAYIAVLGAASFWLFQRRDITGAKGE